MRDSNPLRSLGFNVFDQHVRTTVLDMESKALFYELWTVIKCFNYILKIF